MNHIKYLLDKSELEQWGFYFYEETFLLPGKAFIEWKFNKKHVWGF